MAAALPVTSPPPGPPEEDEGRKPPHHQRIIPNGYVTIVVPNDGHALPASSPPPPHDDADAPEEEEDEWPRPRPPGATSSSLWRAAVAVLALAALAVAVAAGYVSLYGGGDAAAAAAWGRLLEAREDDGDEVRGGRRSFLLPLYPKPRRGGDWPQNSTLFPPTGNIFPEGCVQSLCNRNSVLPFSVINILEWN